MVVSLNHRLNALGFLDLTILGAAWQDSANAGLLDIVAALRWVQELFRSRLGFERRGKQLHVVLKPPPPAPPPGSTRLRGSRSPSASPRAAMPPSSPHSRSAFSPSTPN